MTLRRWAGGVIPGVILGVGVGSVVVTSALADYASARPADGIAEPTNVVAVDGVVTYRTFLEAGDLHTLEVAGLKRNPAEVRPASGAGLWPSVIECGTDNYFDVLGVGASVGRVWRSGEDDGAPVVVLSDAFWRRRLDRRPSVLGETLRVNGAAYQIIGIAKPAFIGVLRLEPADLFVPLTADPEVCLHRGRALLDSGNWLYTIGRLAPGVGVRQAAAELAARGFERPDDLKSLGEARSRTDPRYARATQLGTVAAASLLVLAVCNVIGLQILRSTARRAEVQIRLQLGATRWRLFWTVLGEQAPFILVCGAAAVTTIVLLSLALADTVPAAIGGVVLHPRAALVLLAVTLAASGLTACTTAFGLSRQGLRSAWSPTSPLLIIQVSVTCALVLGTAVMTKSITLLFSQVGFEADRLIVLTGDVFQDGYRSDGDIRRMFEQLDDRLGAIPGVESVSVSSSDLLWIMQSGDRAYLRASLAPGTVPGVAILHGVSGDYDETVGLQMVAGRWLSDTDRMSVVIDESLGNHLWPAGQPVGQCAYFLRDVRCLTVVGVTRSRRPEQVVMAQFEVFMDIEQAQRLEPNVRRRAVLVSTNNPTAVLPAVDRIAIEVAETTGFPPLSARRLSDMADMQTRAIRLATRAMGLFGVLGLLMAGCGIFAVLRFVVSQRVWEIGLRLALGAPRHTVVLAVCGPALRAVSIGALAGVTLAYWGQGLLQSVAIGIATMDTGTVVVAFAGLALAGVCGALGPAIVAARTNPASALKEFRVLER